MWVEVKAVNTSSDLLISNKALILFFQKRPSRSLMHWDLTTKLHSYISLASPKIGHFLFTIYNGTHLMKFSFVNVQYTYAFDNTFKLLK